MSTVPTMVQVRYRFRTDTAAVDSAATWGAAENVNFDPGQETNFRLRFSVNNTGTAAGAGPHVLNLSKNGGAYAPITTSSTGGVQSNASASSSADEAVIATANFRLTAGTGTALAGVYDETGSATKSVTNAFYTEFEYGLIVKTANVAAGDTLDFRIYNSTTAYTTYTQTPRINIPRAALANDVVSTSSVSQPAVTEGTVTATVLIHADGADASTTFTDATPNAHTITATNVAVDTGQSKFGGASAQSTGAGGAGDTPAHLRIANAADLALGTGDYTIDFWVRFASTPGTVGILYEGRPDVATNGPYPTIGADTTHGLFFYIYSTFVITSGSHPSLDTWHHVALTRNSASTRLFLDGTQVGSTLGGDTNDYLSPANPFLMGTAAGYVTNGWMDEFRLVKGTAAWTANFTPPTGAYVVTTPNHACLANDISSASSVTQPAVKQLQGLLANDVTSNSSVTQPTAVIRRDVLANDVKSNSSVGQPVAVIGRNILANDVVSASSVGQPAAVIQRAILANDVLSASFVTNPVVGIVGTLDARDIKSASSVSNPAVKQLQGLLANDIKSNSSVTTPVVAQRQVLDAVNITSASSVTTPTVGEITAGQPLANDVISASFVSQPTLVVISGEVIPPAGGGIAGAPGYDHDRYYRDYEKRERRKRQLERDLVEIVDRAVARVRGEPEPPPRAAEAVILPTVLEDRLGELQGLAGRIGDADVELAALHRQALALAEEAKEAAFQQLLEDDDEALALLLAA